jgi:NADPH:quinone reductase-like Zn-dependent oxidoreductase
MISAPFVEQEHAPFLAALTREDLAFLADLMQAGKVTPVIDRRYRLNEVAEAIAYLEEGHARGKVIVNME